MQLLRNEAGGELSEQGRAALAELMKEGLGDHILMLRIFQVGLFLCCRQKGASQQHVHIQLPHADPELSFCLGPA